MGEWHVCSSDQVQHKEVYIIPSYLFLSNEPMKALDNMYKVLDG